MENVNEQWRIVRIKINPEAGRFFEYMCPKCEFMSVTRDFNYCPKCGFQINWLSTEDSHL